jgi:hypothetical protein
VSRSSQFNDISADASRILAENMKANLDSRFAKVVVTNEERAASIENLIADFLPDCHKDLPVEIAIAVVEALFPLKEESDQPEGHYSTYPTITPNTAVVASGATGFTSPAYTSFASFPYNKISLTDYTGGFYNEHKSKSN